MKRREFLRNLGIIAGAGTAIYKFDNIFLRTFAQPLFNLNSVNGKILVLIQMKGGNDGLNTVIPLDQYSIYSLKRPQIKIEETAAVKITNSTGLHPALSSIKTLYDEGKVSLIQNVGYPNPNRSHFRATDIWLSGSESDVVLYDGWVGRYLLKNFPGFPEVPAPYPLAIQLNSVPSQLFDTSKGGMALSFSNPNDFYTLVKGLSADNDPPPATISGEELKFLKEIANLSMQYGSLIKEKANLGNPTENYPSSRLGPQLKIVADLILGGLQTPVYLTQIDGFDTHSNQLTAHNTLLQNINDSVMAFQKDIEKAGMADKVVIMTFSEFGRRVGENASQGTDHGSAAPVFVIGKNVNGGIIGNNADLSKLDKNGDIQFVYDYRQIYSTILMDHMGASKSDSSDILLKEFTTLPVFKSTTDISDNSSVPVKCELKQNYPNPFNPYTEIEFNINKSGNVRLTVYDILGKEIAVLVNEYKNSGTHRTRFNAANLPSGTYFYKMTTGGFTETKKMLLVK